MRYRADHKERTRKRILGRAAALFRREGYRGVGIDRIMAAAGLTRGGFYAHFPSKAALFAEVLDQESDFARRLRGAPRVRDVISGYLDPENRDKVAKGCTLATLTNDVPRADKIARKAYASHVERLIAEFEAHVPAEYPDRRNRALAAVITCVGGISLARAIGDEGLAHEILDIAREKACAAISGEGE